MGEPTIAERIEQAKKKAQNLKAEIEVRRHQSANRTQSIII